MDASAEKYVLDMYNLAKQRETEAKTRMTELRVEIGEDKANEIDAQSKRILAEIKAKEAAKAAKQQAKEEAKAAKKAAKEEAKITKISKKDNQVNSCRLF